MWDYLKLAGLGLVAVLAAIAANYGHDLAYQVNMITVMLAAGIGSQVEIETNGPDEQVVMDAILALINDKFGEGE